jgi:probable F420-dependent oxidoreductase
MRVDLSTEHVLKPAAEAARRAEDQGFDGVWFGETAHDPFVSIALAATATSRLELGSGVAIAFARSPMTLAMTANDLQLASDGRLLLGLGSQVKAHITRRFSMPWSQPTLRMREFVLATRAIWRSWHEDVRLDFQGDFYSHTLMTPFFNPGANPYGPPKVLLAGVGGQMSELAGEVADGFMCHGFATERYLREVTLPALERGRARDGKSMSDFQISGLPFVVSGRNAEEMAASASAVRDQIAFYASTSTYRAVLDLHGWGDLQVELNALAKAGRWTEMGNLIDEDILAAFAVVAEPADVAKTILERYGDVFTRLHLYLKAPLDDQTMYAIVGDLQGAGQS